MDDKVIGAIISFSGVLISIIMSYYISHRSLSQQKKLEKSKNAIAFLTKKLEIFDKSVSIMNESDKNSEKSDGKYDALVGAMIGNFDSKKKAFYLIKHFLPEEIEKKLNNDIERLSQTWAMEKGKLMGLGEYNWTLKDDPVPLDSFVQFLSNICSSIAESIEEERSKTAKLLQKHLTD